jgi:hypothetical protein
MAKSVCGERREREQEEEEEEVEGPLSEKETVVRS